MPKINGQFTNDTANAMMRDFANFIGEFEREWGVKIEMRGGRFDASTLTPRMTIRLAGETKVEDQYAKEAKDWNLNCRYHTLDPSWLHREVADQHGDRFKVLGLNSRRPKKCVVIMNLKTKKMHVANPAWLTGVMMLKVNQGK